MTEDLVTYAVYYCVVACTLEPWLGICAAISAAAGAAAAFNPTAARWAIGIAGFLNVGAMGIRLFLDRYMKPATNGTAPPVFASVSSTPREAAKR